MDTKPLVSICCATYNHEPFIRDAIEGFLMQEVNFPIEILINDDASTDRTPDILREYEEKHPDLIKVVYQEENQYSKGIKPLPQLLLPLAKGKYIAVCEGDDYWNCRHKLAKQIGFLEKHPDYVISSTNTHYFHDSEGRWQYNIDEMMNDRLVDTTAGVSVGDIVTSRWRVKTPTVVAKRDAMMDVYSKEPFLTKLAGFPLGDTPLWIELLKRGKYHYVDSATAVYRITKGSASRPVNAKDAANFMVRGSEVRAFYIESLADPTDRRHIKLRLARHYIIAAITTGWYDPSPDAITQLVPGFRLALYIFSRNVVRKCLLWAKDVATARIK